MWFGTAHLMKVHIADTEMKTEERKNHYVPTVTTNFVA